MKTSKKYPCQVVTHPARAKHKSNRQPKITPPKKNRQALLWARCRR
jgi:hypothetical protein